MKRTICILLGLAFVMLCAFALADVAIDETNFPDPIFRERIKAFDTNQNGILSSAEISAVKVLDVTNYPDTSDDQKMTSLKGVEYFTAITELICDYNRLTELDISKNTALVKLMCDYNQLTELDTSKNTALESLWCSVNQLTQLDLSRNTALKTLVCEWDQLQALDLSHNTALEYLECSTNPMPAPDLSHNTALVTMWCRYNGWTELDVSKNTALETLVCGGNQLTSLDVSKNAALETLNCWGNQLTSLDVSKNTALKVLVCSQNGLKVLDVSKNTKLEVLGCSDNQLTSLDVSKNTKISQLDCYKNQITRLDISNLPFLCDLVKEVEPEIENGYKMWEKANWNYSEVYSLIIDENVELVFEPAEEPGEPIDISQAKVTAIKDQVYTGKAIKPAVTVKYDGKKLVKGTDYTVAYKNNKKIGTATVTIAGKGDYTGKTTVKFDIIPKAVKLSSLTAGKKQLTVKWTKGSSITGYEIQYCLKKDFKKAETETITKATTTKTVLKKLTAKKTYYVRIRAYKTVGGKKYYSAWSAIKSKKTK